MKKINTINSALLLSALTGQAVTDNIHYPFNHNYDHNEQSICRSYAMARAFYGNYCPAADLGDKAENGID